MTYVHELCLRIAEECYGCRGLEEVLQRIQSNVLGWRTAPPAADDGPRAP